MPLSKLTAKGQITIPKAIRERLGLSAGDKLEFSVDDAGRIVARQQGWHLFPRSNDKELIHGNPFRLG